MLTWDQMQINRLRRQQEAELIQRIFETLNEPIRRHS